MKTMQLLISFSDFLIPKKCTISMELSKDRIFGILSVDSVRLQGNNIGLLLLCIGGVSGGSG